MLQKDIEDKLALYQDPYLGKDLITAKIVKAIEISEKAVMIRLKFPYPFDGIKASLQADLTKLLQSLLTNQTLTFQFENQIDTHVGRSGIAALPQVKNIIAVASGKGGVGKSTVAINLALALAKEGANVGILDADIYGPSQPTMLGTAGKRPVIENKTIAPIRQHGLQSMSIGYLVDGNAAMVWRGPMLGKALEQLMHDTTWQALDYLIVDLPPGTGDVQLTLCQKIPVSGAILVTTPQDLALVDVRRACEMFNKLNVPILGLVENMSGYHCSSCGHEEAVFGQGGGQKLAEEYALNLLGQIPLNIQIREMTDSGYPPVAADPDSPYAMVFREIARKAAAKLSQQTKDYSAKFPKVVVQPVSDREKE